MRFGTRGDRMPEKLAALSRYNVPYVYFGFSRTANRWAATRGQLYLGKIGYSGGSGTACFDRVGSLIEGFHKGELDEPSERWIRKSGPLLGACDWDVFAMAMFDTIKWAKLVERELHAVWRGIGMGEFDTQLADEFIESGMEPNGVNDIVRISPTWLSVNCSGYDELVAKHRGNPLADPVLNAVCGVMHDLFVSVLPRIGAAHAPMESVPTMIATMAENPDGEVRLHDRGPSLIVRLAEDGVLN